MQEHFIQISNDSNETSSGDSISIAETSSSNIRKVLYDYSSYGFTIKPCIILNHYKVIVTLMLVTPLICIKLKSSMIYLLRYLKLQII